MPPESVTVFQPPKSPPVNPAPAAVEHRASPVRSATSVDGIQSTPDLSPAQRLWRADQDAITRSDPWRDTAGTVITRDPVTGVLSSRPRGDAQNRSASDNGAPPNQQQAPQPGQPPQAPQPGSATVEGNTLKVGQWELNEADIASLMASKAERDSRAANMPPTAAEFKLDLSPDFQLPAGTSDFSWDLETPHAAAQLGALKTWAFANQLDQNSFSQLLSIYAGHQLSEQRRFVDAQKAEVTALGANAPTRIDSVNMWLESRIGSALAGALRATMFTSKAVEAYEALMRGFVSQGVSGNPSGGRDGEYGRGPQKVSDEVYAQMSYSEKQRYAAQFSQNR